MAKLPGKEIVQAFHVRSSSADKDTERKEIRIRLFVDMNVGIGGDIWPAAECFCNWMLLDAYYDFFATLYNQKRVLELGSGNALVSILVEKAFSPRSVVCSDLSSHVQHIQHNLEMNSCQVSTSAALDWMDEQDVPGAEAFDVILALECLYKEELYEPLIRAMLRTSHAQSVFFLGVTRAFVKPRFFALLTAHGFTHRKMPANKLADHMPYDPSMGMFVVQRMGTAHVL